MVIATRYVWGLVLLIVSLAWASASLVRADEDRDEKFYKKELQKWAAQVGKFDQRDPARNAAQHVELLRGLLTEGRTLLAQDELDDLEPVLQRIELRGRYVDALLTRIKLEKKADASEQAALKAERKAAGIKKKADATKKRYDELLKQGL